MITPSASVKLKDSFFEPLVSPYELARPVDWSKVFGREACPSGRRAPLDLEIGSGLGEFLIRLAQQFPERDFIGLEQIWERIYKTLKRIESCNQAAGASKIANVRLLQNDARAVLARLIQPQSLGNVYCLFPCPWPKKAHVKYRLFSSGFLKLINSRLVEGGQLKIVTDHEPYFKWVLDCIEDAGFHIKTEKIRPRYDTKFERKWLARGQDEFFEIQLHKSRHIDVAVEEDEELKTYKIKTFDPHQFLFEDKKGEVSVILKEKLYDSQQQKMVLRLIVAEPQMTQYLWVVIEKKDGEWRLAKAEGQKFFPTQGVAYALECVYETAAGSRREMNQTS